MTQSVLIFTFSPVQTFITEARRTSDLFVGSRILVQLAQAAAQAIQQAGGSLIYPAPLAHGHLPGDVPNKLVARVLWTTAEDVGKHAQDALLKSWQGQAESAERFLRQQTPAPDELWETIWQRQRDHFWDIYWAVAQEERGGYAAAYQEASRALDAVKHSRLFDQVIEEGRKDSLSGQRTALRTSSQDAPAYWKRMAENPAVSGARLRSQGRERLDAIAAVKRFCQDALKSEFPSTSTVASRDFRRAAQPFWATYQMRLIECLGKDIYRPSQDDLDWPFDGDLLYTETLTTERLRDSYDLAPAGSLPAVRQALRDLYKDVDWRPSPYYAIIALDGDSMGQRVTDCLTEPAFAEDQHRALSLKLSAFAAHVRQIEKLCVNAAGQETPSFATLIYNGGDDVLALAPLSTAFDVARTLAGWFEQMTGGTCSAGISIAHHLFPLGRALQAARQAEKQAKRLRSATDETREKAAVCIRVLKRSGEEYDVRSRWESAPVGGAFDQIVKHFQAKTLSTRLAYEALAQAPVAGGLPPEAQKALLKRLLGRHKNPVLPSAAVEKIADDLADWSLALDDVIPRQEASGPTAGFLEMARCQGPADDAEK
ncbi:MAG: type III-B CRISPR-associated protein Cas10/Cmr2, partial [Anaerolineae bacterium]